MITIEHSQQFREEYDRFQAGILAITDTALKEDLTIHLSKLLGEVRTLDSLHRGADIHAQLQEIAPTHRNTLMDLRTYIDRRLKDWQARQ